MIKITGQYSSAVCYTDSMEEPSKEQILRMCNQKIYAGQKIRIMPDVHAGKGCTIGTTMSINGRVTPNLVGVDIGCGMETVRFAEKEVDFEALDNLIRKKIPYGMNIRKSVLFRNCTREASLSSCCQCQSGRTQPGNSGWRKPFH